jgi:hypothetical protein
MAKIKKAQNGKEVGKYFLKDPKYKNFGEGSKKPMTSVQKSDDSNYRKKRTYSDIDDDGVSTRNVKEKRTVKGFLTGAPKAGGKMVETLKKGGKVTKAKPTAQMLKQEKKIKSQTKKK